MTRYIKELGIVFSYTIMLMACMFFAWESFAVFVSFLIEILVLFLVYVFLNFRYQKNSVDVIIAVLHIMKVLIGMIPLFLFHYFIIGFLVHMINPNFDVFKDNILLTKEVLYAGASMLLFYTLNVFQISNQENKIIVFQNKIIVQVLLLTGSNIIGFVAVIVLGINSLLAVLTIMVIARVLMEIYFLRITY